jgi:hypothetical protein
VYNVWNLRFSEITAAVTKGGRQLPACRTSASDSASHSTQEGGFSGPTYASAPVSASTDIDCRRTSIAQDDFMIRAGKPQAQAEMMRSPNLKSQSFMILIHNPKLLALTTRLWPRQPACLPLPTSAQAERRSLGYMGYHQWCPSPSPLTVCGRGSRGHCGGCNCVKPLQAEQLIIYLCFANLPGLPNRDSDSCPRAHQTLS